MAQEGMGKGTLDIIFGAFDFTLVGLPVETVADFQVPDRNTGKSRQIVRRRSFAFGKLTPEQLFNLKRFLLLNRYGAKQQAGKPIKRRGEGVGTAGAGGGRAIFRKPGVAPMQNRPVILGIGQNAATWYRRKVGPLLAEGMKTSPDSGLGFFDPLPYFGSVLYMS